MVCAVYARSPLLLVPFFSLLLLVPEATIAHAARAVTVQLSVCVSVGVCVCWCVCVCVCVRGCRDLETLTTFKRFRFGQRFQLESADAFLRDFFNSADVRAALPVYSSARAPAHLTGTVAAVDMDRLRTTVLNMEFFDRCQESDLVTESGCVCRCAPAAPPMP